MDINNIAPLCRNEIRLVGTITEFAGTSYKKNGVGVIKYKGVVNCNNAFINIKATTTSFDGTFSAFINEFDADVIDKKVFIIGRLNSIGGIDVSYIALSQDIVDWFEGIIHGIIYEDNKVLVIDNNAHEILNLSIPYEDTYDEMVCQINLRLNPLIADDGVMGVDDNPVIDWDTLSVSTTIGDELKEIIDQALEEHQIYIEAMKQIKEGR